MARFTGNTVNGNAEPDDAKVAGSYVATADYYFTSNYSFRPFVVGGAGVFSLSNEYENFDARSLGMEFGGIVRVGAEITHFRFGREYNIIPGNTAYRYDNTTGNSVPTFVKNGYFGIKFGVCFGGGPL
ncbi:MAG: hypothetical protein WKI04_07305 [Ferruginibacter sp.]